MSKQTPYQTAAVALTKVEHIRETLA